MYRSGRLEKVKAALGQLPGTIIADAGYGGEENYTYLESEQLRGIVKYSKYHKEKSKKWQQDISKIDNWHYDEREDTWTNAWQDRNWSFDTRAKSRPRVDLIFGSAHTAA